MISNMEQRRDRLESFLLKCDDALTKLKEKRRFSFVHFGDSRNDQQIKKLTELAERVVEELRGIDIEDDVKLVEQLHDEYDNLSDLQNELLSSLDEEFENIDKEIWYNENFDDWKMMPERQECEEYPLAERVCYSKCRRKMFKHLENDWKKRTFPTLHDRLEFF